MGESDDLKSLLGDLSSEAAATDSTPPATHSGPNTAAGQDTGTIHYPSLAELLGRGDLAAKAESFTQQARALKSAASRYSGHEAKRLELAAKAFQTASQVLPQFASDDS